MRLYTSFNGAATLSLRKPLKVKESDIVTDLLQWSRNFIVAETGEFGLLDPPFKVASMGPQLYRCGNCWLCPVASQPARASMGPQLYRCGNENIPADARSALQQLQWGRNFIVAEILPARLRGPTNTSFNGAATLSLRKPGFQVLNDGYVLPLQWGRNFIVAETGCSGIGFGRVVGASMGPQLYRCGNYCLPCWQGCPKTYASMGPQLYRCGNVDEL